jgi:regulator of protease activity HflC (stomatin/prohibitin superfamily)
MGSLFALVLVVVAVFFVLKTVRVVPQGYEWTKETFGRYTATMEPGLHILVPIYHAVGHKMNMMEQVVDVPSQDVITKDNAVVRVDGVVFYQVLDAAKAAYEVSNLNQAILNLIMTNIRTVLGSMDLDESLSKRDDINARLLRVVEGFRQAAILKAEGEKQAAILAAEGQREAAYRAAEARERSAQAEAKAVEFVSQAIRAGDINAVNYFVATKYVEALKAMVGAPNQKIMLLPMEATGILGSLAGIAELAKSSLLDQQAAKVPANPA